MNRESMLVAVIGRDVAVLMQCYAKDEDEAVRACSALFLDNQGEPVEAKVIDRGATPGLYLVGDPAYIRSVIND